MDCDFTHSPADIKRILERGRDFDVVLGSRYLNPGSLAGWNIYRKFLTMLGHFLTKQLLGMPYDASGALRSYRLGRIPVGIFNLVRSESYSFFFESLFMLSQNGMSVHEISIMLPPRTYGHSKMSCRDIRRSVRALLSLFLRNIARPEQFRVTIREPDLEGNLQDPQGWDDYWNPKRRASSIVYDFVAGLYRRMVIRRRLNHFIMRHFRHGARLLHAGCGSGQVDVDVQRDMQITALDISKAALQFYTRNNPGIKALKHGSILNLPFEDGLFDGVYNLGVVEHFTQAELEIIFGEFHRVLEPKGKLVLFWPHRFATSVIFLRMIQRLLRLLPGAEECLHPPEVSLLRSRQQARDLLSAAGFRVIDYYFGLRDLFVQAVVVAERTDT